MADDLRSILARWRQALIEQDVTTAAALRDDRYTATLPDGGTLTKAEELAFLTSADYRVASVRMRDVRSDADRATAVFECVLEMGSTYTSTVDFHARDGRWLAIAANVQRHVDPAFGTRPKESIVGRLRRRFTRRAPSFQSLAYLPYMPQEDYALPRASAPSPDGELPVPPKSLWLGYHYSAQGQAQVETMFDILRASDFELRPGDRVLDFGCGAGRLIRHLRSVAETCEVWGTDISAEHIVWCKRNLSPPLRFATTTKVPHLPFEDRSFRLIYCASVFTHIDDLADAWLLELGRILTPDGRLFLTIHDNRTIEIMERASQANRTWLDWVRGRRVYREHKDSFDMMTIGRDNDSQVFYDRDYFCRMAGQTFDVVSVTPEAHFYQTAVVLKRKAGR